ncbi:MAG: hypothetical protein FWD06_05815 [Oscillospiraceae bacterium]|nr:hypothetical protein [Oscillospiraceae bacterium]
MLKRTLALLFTVAIAFALALPVGATQTSANAALSAMPVITQQPPQTQPLFIPSGWILITVRAHIPSGDPVGFHWYVIRGNAEPQRFRETITDTLQVSGSGFSRGDRIFAVAYNRNETSTNEIPNRVQSRATTLRNPNLWERFNAFIVDHEFTIFAIILGIGSLLYLLAWVVIPIVSIRWIINLFR